MISIPFQKMQQDALTALYRFPFAITSSLLLTFILLNEAPLFPWPREALYSLFSIGILLFTSLRLVSESYKGNHWLFAGIGLVTFGVLGIYFCNLPILRYPFTLMGLGFALLTMIAPFLRKNVAKEMIWQFNYDLYLHFFFSLLATFILGLGLAFLLISLEYLFHFQLIYGQYQKLSVILLYFFLPIMIMAGIPTHFDKQPDPQKGKGIQLILDYVLTPILLMFGLIIICYAAKIVLMQNLPRGKVSYLVSILGGAGTLAYVLGESGKEALSLCHRVFRKYFFFIMVIPLVLMGIGIGVRIHQYGITELRYVDALLLLWLTLCVFHSFIANRQKLLQFMFASSAVLLILASFGPWGILEISTCSQIKILQDFLEKKEILVNNTIQKKHPLISDGDAYEITSKLRYIIARGKAHRLRGWFGPQADTVFKEPNQTNISADKLVHEMGIVRDGNKKTQPFDFIIRHSQYKPTLIDVEGYDYVLPNLNIFSTEVKGTQNTYVLPKLGQTLQLNYDQSTQTLTLKRLGTSKPLISVPVADVLSKLKETSDPAMIDKYLTYEGTEGSLNATLLIQYIQGDKSHQPSYSPFHYIMLTILVKSVK